MDTEAIAAFDLLSRMRFACGDNGKRMQDELEEYLRGLKRDAERYRWLRIKCGLVPSAFGIGQVAMTLAGSTDERDAKRLDAHIDAAMQGANAAISGPRSGSAA